MSKKVYLKNYGCQMNVRDSEVIRGLLVKEGYEFTEDSKKADVVIINTCAVRQHAEDRVWSEIGRIVELSSVPPRFTAKGAVNLNRGDTRPMKKIIGLVGCMAQEHKEQAFTRAPNLDFIVGPADIHKITDIIKRLKTKDHRPSNTGLFERKIWETDGLARPEEIYHTGFYEDKEHAYVVISEGCSNYCSYCVVPYVRGQLRNRNYKDILREIEEAADRGITKITLLGQNVNAYQTIDQRPKTKINFIELIRLINQIDGLKEFSFITSHPKDTSAELFKAMAEYSKLKKWLHLPLQSGSDKILKLMNRGYTRKFYLDLIDNYRKIVKNGLLSTDIIVGFPAETEEDFQGTFNLVKDAEFNSAYLFKYSARPNTEAAKMADTVTKEEKERRHKLILELQRKISKGKK